MRKKGEKFEQKRALIKSALNKTETGEHSGLVTYKGIVVHSDGKGGVVPAIGLMKRFDKDGDLRTQTWFFCEGEKKCLLEDNADIKWFGHYEIIDFADPLPTFSKPVYSRHDIKLYELEEAATENEEARQAEHEVLKEAVLSMAIESGASESLGIMSEILNPEQASRAEAVTAGTIDLSGGGDLKKGGLS